MAGLIGPDEPRYASIGREMAFSGDWVTPRLWGAAWFEKPALLYWMIGTAHRLGLPAEMAARLPVAICGALFTCFFWWSLRRLNRPEEAEKSAREALLRDPSQANAYLVLADSFARRQNYAEQIQDLDAYLTLEPSGPVSQRAQEVRAVAQRLLEESKRQN